VDFAAKVAKESLKKREEEVEGVCEKGGTEKRHDVN